MFELVVKLPASHARQADNLPPLVGPFDAIIGIFPRTGPFHPRPVLARPSLSSSWLTLSLLARFGVGVWGLAGVGGGFVLAGVGVMPQGWGSQISYSGVKSQASWTRFLTHKSRGWGPGWGKVARIGVIETGIGVPGGEARSG